MKPKIQLVGGCASSFVSEVPSTQIPNPGNDSNQAVISMGGEAGKLLAAFVETIISAMGASAAIVRILSPDGQALRSMGCAGLPAEICQAETSVGSDCGVCGKSAKTQDVESSDTDDCKSRYGATFFDEFCMFVLAVPLESREKVDGEPAGVITLFFAEEQVLTEDLKNTLKSYLDLIQISLKSLWENEELHQLNLLSERRSIANEIHDSLAQNLYYAKMRASLLMEALKTDNDLLAYKCAQDIDEALEGSQKTVRELVTHFRCQMDPKGLKFALQKLVSDFTARTRIHMDYVNQLEAFDLPLDYELQIFLIIREALVNIATHSGASNAHLKVVCVDGQYQFTVEDNGAGVASIVPPEGHYGLAIMRERALNIGGVVEVESLEGLGTRVQLMFRAPEAMP